MGVCDAHEAVLGKPGTISSGEGYLLAARFMQNSKVQDRNIDIHIALYKQLGRSMSREEAKLETESVQGATPWLICKECTDFLELSNMDKEAAREAARKWWKDRSTPGHMPDQKMRERDKKPAYFMIFGNGFTPSEKQAHLVLRAWVDKVEDKLGKDVWEHIRMELRSLDRASTKEFIKVVPEAKKAHPRQLVDDILLLDKKTGQDIALIAVWAPEDSEYVGSLLKQGKAKKPAATEEKTKQIQEPVGEKPKDIYEVLMDAICCVMCADRKVVTRERKAVHTIMERTKAPWSEGQVENRINDFIQRVNKSGLNNVIQQTYGKLSEFKKIGKEEVLLRCIDYMARADGIVDEKEKQLIDKFKFVLGIKSDDLVDSAIQVRTPKSGEKVKSEVVKQAGVSSSDNTDASESSRLTIPEKLEKVKLTRSNTEGFITSHMRGLDEDSILETADNFWANSGNFEMCVLNRRKNTPFLLLNSYNGVRSGACLNMSDSGYAIIPISCLQETVAPKELCSKEALLRWYKQISAKLAKSGSEKALVLHNNGNGNNIEFWIEKDNPGRLYFDTRFMKKGTFKPSDYNIVISAGKVKSVSHGIGDTKFKFLLR